MDNFSDVVSQNPRSTATETARSTASLAYGWVQGWIAPTESLAYRLGAQMPVEAPRYRPRLSPRLSGGPNGAQRGAETVSIYTRGAGTFDFHGSALRTVLGGGRQALVRRCGRRQGARMPGHR